ncbi:UDP-2,3-diacylglucosamine hydrolase [Pararcticibacter amylolyticus]|uniref:UDP-2,3-diacylglucosamine hydrolase n=2 Tax=Pararcticibacter amylolyticus TaxID=2173175 RepID=A0A2U2PMG0_9SPHI|nr:UDP-2,3-diacylglucosamine diphosphatase [Pararcticibacter amylolyticus]PWG82494.1 UDP-2,3-diacylglucosamine hydrolase [Pararcticibacter amylolyticus]
MSIRNKIYFASDFHLGVADYKLSRQREANVVAWLDSIKEDASELYLVGDVFDFWFEYRHAVPKGFTRFFGKLAELADLGVRIIMFKGNHDMWMFGYLSKEMGVEIVSDELIIERGGKRFYIHHGDGLGPGDLKYKVLKKIFRSKVCQWLFARIHPNLGIGIALAWSRRSRIAGLKKERFLGDEKEWLVVYSKEILKREHFDYFIYGHRHLPLDIKLNESSRYVNLGEWISYFSYAVFDAEGLSLRYFKRND